MKFIIKQIKLGAILFCSAITSPKLMAQEPYQHGDVKYTQKVFYLLGQQGFPYVVLLTVDSLSLDSVSGDHKYFHFNRVIYGCNNTLFKKATDTTWLIQDSIGIAYSGKYEYQSPFFHKDSSAYKENLRYWQFHKHKGETIVVDRVGDSLKVKQEHWVIDSIVNQEFFGIKRDIYFLSMGQYNQCTYTDGIGFSDDKTNLRFEVGDEMVLLVCGAKQPKYFRDNYFNPLHSADCNFDTIAAQFSRFHTASAASARPNQIRVFPNPVADILHVENELPNEAFLYQILNLNGSIVLETTATNSISVSGLPCGTYVLQKQSARGIAHCKFVLMR